ncbi:hypothetical protein BVJ53_04700 [Lacticaseibacillus chiayiensis]|uniref:Alpha-galactosidase n=1 Tax=Lacticaseibacillus chiayiensis TaxID=2100821 RepID=A0A4Q1U7N3_9LACO|nr:hypothetical protein BVJ53_04700 [Lacticaseibacillus chiayiensis]
MTRSLAQKPACKGLGRNGQEAPLHPRPLTLRLLTAPVHAHTKKRASARSFLLIGYWRNNDA